MARIVRLPGSGRWFTGGVVAYDEQIKFDLLRVTPGPVVTADAAMQMARGVRDLLGSDLGFSTTGEAGPVASEPTPVGTLFVGVADGALEKVVHTVLPGGPDEIREAAAGFVVDLLLEQIGAQG